MADNVIETGRSRIEDILLSASNGEPLSRIEEILLSLYQDLVHLDDQGLIPASLLPPQVFEHCEVVVDDTARFALTTDDVQNGDLVYVNSSQTMYFVLDDTKLDREAGYLPLAAGVAAKAIADEYGNNISQTYATKQELGGKQDTIDTTHKLSADLVDDSTTTNKFTNATEKETWNGKQDAIDSTHKLGADLVDDSSSTNKFTNATEKETWNGKQDAIDSTHKLSADLVDDSTATNKFTNATEKAKVARIIMDSTETTNVYVQATQPTGNIPEGSIWFDTAVSGT